MGKTRCRSKLCRKKTHPGHPANEQSTLRKHHLESMQSGIERITQNAVKATDTHSVTQQI